MKTRFIFFFVAALLSIWAFTQTPFVQREPAAALGAMRYDPVAASGQCTLDFIKTDAQAQKILELYNMKTPGSNAQERINLANGLYQAAALNGGRFEPLVDINVKFESRTGFSRFVNKDATVQLNRCDKFGRKCGDNSNINVARLMHELGHATGHYTADGSTHTFYDLFESHASGCHPTGYSDNNTNENVAEVFSAFLTHPTLLSNGSRACARAYDYLATQVFKANGKMASCDHEVMDTFKHHFRGVQADDTVDSLAAMFK